MNKAKAIAASAEYIETRRLVILTLLTIVAYLLCISPVYAQLDFMSAVVPDSKMAQVICSIYGIIAFDIGRGLATLAIAGLGVGAMLGRVTWGQLATVAVGIGVTIGAIVIAYALLPLGWGATISVAKCGAQARLSSPYF